MPKKNDKLKQYTKNTSIAEYELWNSEWNMNSATVYNVYLFASIINWWTVISINFKLFLSKRVCIETCGHSKHYSNLKMTFETMYFEAHIVLFALEFIHKFLILNALCCQLFIALHLEKNRATHLSRSVNLCTILPLCYEYFFCFLLLLLLLHQTHVKPITTQTNVLQTEPYNRSVTGILIDIHGKSIRPYSWRRSRQIRSKHNNAEKKLVFTFTQHKWLSVCLYVDLSMYNVHLYTLSGCLNVTRWSKWNSQLFTSHSTDLRACDTYID